MSVVTEGGGVAPPNPIEVRWTSTLVPCCPPASQPSKKGR
jgi:hypothetical protein